MEKTLLRCLLRPRESRPTAAVLHTDHGPVGRDTLEHGGRGIHCTNPGTRQHAYTHAPASKANRGSRFEGSYPWILIPVPPVPPLATAFLSLPAAAAAAAGSSRFIISRAAVLAASASAPPTSIEEPPAVRACSNSDRLGQMAAVEERGERRENETGQEFVDHACHTWTPGEHP